MPQPVSGVFVFSYEAASFFFSFFFETYLVSKSRECALDLGFESRTILVRSEGERNSALTWYIPARRSTGDSNCLRKHHHTNLTPTMAAVSLVLDTAMRYTV